MNDSVLKNIKGTFDFLPEEQVVRKKIINVLEKNFSLYGFLPLESTILCSFELLASKYAGGAEILKEVYKLNDQGDRNIGLRYDLTVPFAKVIGMQKDLHLPFKRYEIGKVFRDGPVKPGRLREFYQCDIDICGSEALECEIEFFTMTKKVFDELKINIEIHWNNRKLLVGILEYVGVPGQLHSSVILSVDKLEKISREDVLKELNEKGLDEKTINKVFDLLGKDFAYFKDLFKDTTIETLKEGLEEVEKIMNYTMSLNMDYCVFKPFLARGLEIYTGTVWEIFDKEKHITSSLGGGGRYDNIITKFIDDGNKYPAIGMSFGLEPIYEIMKKTNDESTGVLDVIIFPFDMGPKIIEIASVLRQNEIKVSIELNKNKLKKALDFANKNNVPYVLIIGEDEINSGKYALKIMSEGNQISASIDEIIKEIKG